MRRRMDLGQDETPALQITPMINVIIVIVAVFAGGSALTRIEDQLGIKLPTFLFERPGPSERPAILDVRADGRYFIADRPVAERELTAALGDLPLVMIRPDASARHELVVRALEACSAAGVGRVTFAPSR